MPKDKEDQPKIDDQAYQDGKSFFGEGGSIRDVAQRLIDVGEEPYANYGDRRTAEMKQISFCIGFADALLTKLRRF